MPKEIKVIFGVDIDAVGGWLGSYGGEDSPSDIQRGMFAGDIGTPRLLNLFLKHDIPASWFIPGHSIETVPDSVKLIVDAGHETGATGHARDDHRALRRQRQHPPGHAGQAPQGFPGCRQLLTRLHPLLALSVIAHPRGPGAAWQQVCPRGARLRRRVAPP